MALCAELSLPNGSALHHVKNTRAVLGVQGSVPVPSCLTGGQGLDFLLRQAVVVSCSALESFVWDILRENALTVIKARGRKADQSLKDITLTLDDYLSLEDYTDPDERLKEIILKRFERGTLYDSAKIDEVMKILNVRDFWPEVKNHTGLDAATIRSQTSDLILRRNQIAHRADRPEDSAPPEEFDPHGLRPITLAWTNTRVATAKAFVHAAAASVQTAITQLETIIAQKEEQRLAQQTMQPPAAPALSVPPSSEQNPPQQPAETVGESTPDDPMTPELIATIQSFTLNARKSLEREAEEQLQGLYGWLPDGSFGQGHRTRATRGGRDPTPSWKLMSPTRPRPKSMPPPPARNSSARRPSPG